MLECFLQTEEELRRRGQELAVAWRRGRAAYVLDCLEAESTLRGALLAILVHDLLARWDPIQAEWPRRFCRALVSRSEGWLTDEELQELTGRYRRQFGASPPAFRACGGDSRNPLVVKRSREDHARRIRAALDLGEPIVRQPSNVSQPTQFLRRRRAL